MTFPILARDATGALGMAGSFSSPAVADIHHSVVVPERHSYITRGLDPVSSPSYGGPGDE